jgi:CubicO group peptidase (beta-lactamase class C family)
VAAARYQAEFDAAVKRKEKPVFVQGYRTSDGHRFAAAFEPAGAAAILARHDLDAKQYQKVFDTEAAKGWRPTNLAGYATAQGTRFAIVLAKSAGDGRWHARHGLTAAEFQKEFDAQGAKDMRLLCVSGYPEGAGSRYAGLWVAAGSDLPVSGPPVPKLAAFDTAMLKMLRDKGVRSASLAVSRNGKTVLAHGYGFRDRSRTLPTTPETPFRFASDIKPITAATVRLMLAERQAGKALLGGDDKAFALIGYAPTAGGDARLKDVTINHLLAHTGGWDRGAAKYDPMFDVVAIAQSQGVAPPAGPAHVIKHMMGQPLQHAPGAKSAYSNFGYCVLGRVIEKKSGRGYVEEVRRRLATPLGMSSLKLGRTLPRFRDPAEPFYDSPGFAVNVFDPKGAQVPSADGGFHLEAMDAHGGMIASAPDLVKFLQRYWISGQPRTPGGTGQSWTHTGKLDGTFAIVRQLPNGVEYAALFNRRTEDDAGMIATLDGVAKGIADWP